MVVFGQAAFPSGPKEEGICSTVSLEEILNDGSRSRPTLLRL